MPLELCRRLPLSPLMKVMRLVAHDWAAMNKCSSSQLIPSSVLVLSTYFLCFITRTDNRHLADWGPIEFAKAYRCWSCLNPKANRRLSNSWIAESFKTSRRTISIITEELGSRPISVTLTDRHPIMQLTAPVKNNHHEIEIPSGEHAFEIEVIWNSVPGS